ncbi:MAG: MarR family winged helix-turn-helix transcriptional regulator [Burkholderiaceae bacterium]|jgi:DNA-binding MarR family transcriptional regulator
MATPVTKTSATPTRGKAARGDASPAETATLSWLAVVRAYNLCDAVLASRLATLGLRVPEHEVLVNLNRAPGLTQQQLAQRCFVAKSGVSMLVSRMEHDGLVRREADPVDGRIRRLSLTARGTTLARRAQALQDEVVRAMAEPVTAAELDMVRNVMERVGARLQALLD